MRASIQADLEAFYRLPLDKMLVSHGNRRLAVQGRSGQWVFGFIVNNILDDKPIFTFAYDCLMTLEHVRLITEEFHCQYVSPALEFFIAARSLSEILRAVKTKQSIVDGSRFQEVDVVQRPVDSDFLDDFVARKRIAYPTANRCHEDYLQAQGYQCRVLRGSANDKFLYDLLVYTRGDELVGSSIVTTDDETLRKRYSPYIMAHVQGVKLAFQEGRSVARYAMFYPYKAIFGQIPCMYPALSIGALTDLPWEEF